MYPTRMVTLLSLLPFNLTMPHDHDHSSCADEHAHHGEHSHGHGHSHSHDEDVPADNLFARIDHSNIVALNATTSAPAKVFKAWHERMDEEIVQ